MSNDLSEVERPELSPVSMNSICCWHRYGDGIARDCTGHYPMRAALQDPKRYEWPGEKKADGSNVYEFGTVVESYKKLKLQRRLGISKIEPKNHQKGFVFQRCVSNECKGDNLFRRPVAVKELKNKNMREVEAMRDLRHPHIALFLTTFTDSPSFTWTVTYPAGCCDLGEFMLCISNKIAGVERPPIDQTSDIEPNRYGEAEEFERPYRWPYEMKLKDQLRMLRRYFLCLCQALAYLHSPLIRVRHKDIKPENMVIDLYGNIILIDFSISRKFHAENLHMTSQLENDRTEKYRTPENDLNQARDGRSDIWQLGCVFLEMVSLLYGISLRDCEKYCSHTVEGSNGGKNVDYVLNSDGIDKLLNKLQNSEIESDLSVGSAALSTIRAMLSPIEKRPLSGGLWKQFDFAGQGKCPDCHPDSHDSWQPTAADKDQNHTSRLKRLDIEKDDMEGVLEGASEEGNERMNDARKTLEMVQQERAETLQNMPLNTDRLSVHGATTLDPESADNAQKNLRLNDKENVPLDSNMVGVAAKDHDPEPLPPLSKSVSKSPTRRRTSQTSIRFRDMFNISKGVGSSTDLPSRSPKLPQAVSARQSGDLIEPASVKDEKLKRSSHSNPVQSLMQGISAARSSTPSPDRRSKINREDRVVVPPSPPDNRVYLGLRKRNSPPVIASPSDTEVVAYSKSMKCLVFVPYDNIKDTCVHFKLPHRSKEFFIQYDGRQNLDHFNLSKMVMGVPLLDRARELGVWVECSREERDVITLIPTDSPDPVWPSRQR